MQYEIGDVIFEHRGLDELNCIIMLGSEQMQNEMKRIKRAHATRQRRQDPEVREKERMRNLIATRLRRQDPEIRAKERERNRMAMRLRRQNPQFREKERLAMIMRKLNIGIPMASNVAIQYSSVVGYESHMPNLTMSMPEQSLKMDDRVNGSLPLELEMRVEEEDVDDPDEEESKSCTDDFDESQEADLPVPVEVSITPDEESYQVEQEEANSVDSTTLHEEVDIKEEDADAGDEGLPPPFQVNIKEEPREDDEDEEEFYETPSDNKDPPEVDTSPSSPSTIVDSREDHSEEEILPHAAMVVVPGHADEYPEGFVEENVAVKPAVRTVKRQKVTSKRVDTVYRCPNCSLCYTSPQYLAGHVRRGCRYRPSPIKNAYICVVCGEGFNNYGDLYQHKRQKHASGHTAPAGEAVPVPVAKGARAVRGAGPRGGQPRSFQCPNCPRTFTAPGYLVQHQRSHVRQQTDHSCDLCGDSFRHKPRDDVEQHFLQQHPDKEIHGCAHCDRIYGQRQNLVTHLQSHGEYECFVCNKQFSTQQLLTAHFRTHALNQPFECDICHKVYWQQGRYFEHRRKTHNLVEKPNENPKEIALRNQELADQGPRDVQPDDDEIQVVSVVSPSQN